MRPQPGVCSGAYCCWYTRHRPPPPRTHTHPSSTPPSARSPPAGRATPRAVPSSPCPSRCRCTTACLTHTLNACTAALCALDPYSNGTLQGWGTRPYWMSVSRLRAQPAMLPLSPLPLSPLPSAPSPLPPSPADAPGRRSSAPSAVTTQPTGVTTHAVPQPATVCTSDCDDAVSACWPGSGQATAGLQQLHHTHSPKTSARRPSACVASSSRSVKGRSETNTSGRLAAVAAAAVVGGCDAGSAGSA